jgi:hypothetical protein
MSDRNSCPNCNSALTGVDKSVVVICQNCSAPLKLEQVEPVLKTKIMFIAFFIACITIQICDLFFYDIIGDSYRKLFVTILLIGLLLSTIFVRHTYKLVVSNTYLQPYIANLTEEIRQHRRLLENKIGAIDFLIQGPEFRNKVGLDGLLSPLLKIHNERIGGLSIEEQNDAVSRLSQNVSLHELVREEVDKVEMQINKLKSFMEKF